MTGYLHFGFGAEPRQTLEVEYKIAEMPWQKAGLTYTATGYGPRIPSRYMVKFEGRWRRVYIACYGNAASHYIGPRKNWIATFDLQ